MRFIGLVGMVILTASASAAEDGQIAEFFAGHCEHCHAPATKKGGLDLTSLRLEGADPQSFARWAKIYDRIESGEMPPKPEPRPEGNERAVAAAWIKRSLIAAERDRIGDQPRTRLRRLTRA